MGHKNTGGMISIFLHRELGWVGESDKYTKKCMHVIDICDDLCKVFGLFVNGPLMKKILNLFKKYKN